VEATIEWVCEERGERVDALFETLDLKREDLGEVAAAWKGGDKVKACKALLEHYAKSDQAKRWGRDPVEAGEDTTAAAEAILRDEYTFQNVTGSPERKADGSLEWTYRGPNDDAEWAYFLNRHQHLGALHGAYRKTGNDRYIDRIDSDIREWVTVNPYPWEKTNDPRWRGLETMFRINVWSRLFYNLINDDRLRAGTRILLLSSIPEHAHYTQHYHNPGGNWLAMQMRSLSLAGLAFPEFRDQEAWLAYGYHSLIPQMERQIYPDGAQKELSSHYHGATLQAFQAFADLYERADQRLSDTWYEGLEQMWNYWAYSMRPDGHGVLNNDSNLDFNRPKLLRVFETYDRPDWAFIASNGVQGEQPAGSPSRIFPWAGQLISRSGWDAAAHWSVFDVGPWGIGHQHQDKLHFSASAFGQDFLVDAGRLYYKRDVWRDWIQSTKAHNTLIIDGCNQNPDIKEVDAPIEEKTYVIDDAFDYARSSFTAGYEGLEGEAVHHRAVMYVRGLAWIVVDRVESNRDRQIETLWHFHPDVDVRVEGNQSIGSHGTGSMSVVPIGEWSGSVEMVSGQEPPKIQGWYSREYNQKAASTCSVYETASTGKAMAWVIVPSKDGSVQIDIQMEEDGDVVRVSGSVSGTRIEAALPMADGAPSLIVD
jgi:hypothetical protein